MVSWQNYYAHGRIECSQEEFEFEFEIKVTKVSEKGYLKTLDVVRSK